MRVSGHVAGHDDVVAGHLLQVVLQNALHTIHRPLHRWLVYHPQATGSSHSNSHPKGLQVAHTQRSSSRSHPSYSHPKVIKSLFTPKRSSSRSHPTVIESLTPKGHRVTHTQRSSSHSHPKDIKSLTPKGHKVTHTQRSSSHSHPKAIKSLTPKGHQVTHTQRSSSHSHPKNIKSLTPKGHQVTHTQRSSSHSHPKVIR